MKDHFDSFQLQHRTAAEKDARNRLTVGAQYRVSQIFSTSSMIIFVSVLDFFTNSYGSYVCITSRIHALY